ncbi:MAG TPA: C39 family peptidase [Anaerolineales bacterium]|nr:C39 family peptidase [Anaerolineales bacterium]
MDASDVTSPGEQAGPVFYAGLSEQQLLPYFQSQYPGNAEGCGPFSIAIAANLCNRNQAASNYLGANIQAILEQKGLKLRGYGMPTWFGYTRSLGNFARGRVEYRNHASIADLQLAISSNKIVVVALAWQTTWEILVDIPHATVGHYMVAIGYDHSSALLYFLNPGLQAQDGSSHLYSMACQEFDRYWNGTSNLFVQPGSMWMISPTNG